MTRVRSFAITLGVVLGLPVTLTAQQPFGGGSAAGYGIAAVVEARGGLAGAWNPALAILGRDQSEWTMLGLNYEGESGMRQLLETGRRLFRSTALREMDTKPLGALTHEAGVLHTSGRAEVLWFAARQGSRTASLTTRGWLDAYVPGSVLDLAEGDLDALVGGVPPATRHILVTELAIAQAIELGHLPALGRLWAGAGVRLRHAHRNAIAFWSDAVPGRQVHWENYADTLPIELRPETYVARFEEFRMGGQQAVTLDIGVLAQPAEPLIVSVALLDLASAARGGELRYRDRLLLPEGNGLLVMGRDADLVHDTTRYVREMDAFMRRIARPMPRLRGGFSAETQYGRLFGAAEGALGGGIDLDSESALSFTLGWAGPAVRTSPRFSWSGRLDGEHVLAGALSLPIGGLTFDIEGRRLMGSGSWGFSALFRSAVR